MPNRSLNFAVGTSPVETATQGAQQFQQAHGFGSGPSGFGHVVMSPTMSNHIAAAYSALPDHDNKALPAFRAMRDEVHQQFNHLTAPVHRGGMGFEVNASGEDPYPDIMDGGSKKLFDDIANRKINVLSTKATGGHPFFSNDENDEFRAVHDVFGHAATGRGVDMHGEEAAYQKHAAMFSPLARQAMATETRGQNAALHATGSFQDQKVALLPAAMQQRGFSVPRSPRERMESQVGARMFQKRQGL